MDEKIKLRNKKQIPTNNPRNSSAGRLRTNCIKVATSIPSQPEINKRNHVKMITIPRRSVPVSNAYASS